jgi:putative membrane protein
MKRMVPLVCGCVLALAGGGTAWAASAKPSGLDRQYLTTSMQGDLFEIAGGKIALKLSKNPAVITLAKTLIKDHTDSFKQSEARAGSLGVEVPKGPTMSQQWELQIVSSLRGHSFNRWYSSLEAYDHEQDISETTDEVSNGSLTEVRMDAKHELPTLNRHLELARAALRAST